MIESNSWPSSPGPWIPVEAAEKAAEYVRLPAAYNPTALTAASEVESGAEEAAAQGSGEAKASGEQATEVLLTKSDLVAAIDKSLNSVRYRKGARWSRFRKLD